MSDMFLSSYALLAYSGLLKSIEKESKLVSGNYIYPKKLHHLGYYLCIHLYIPTTIFLLTITKALHANMKTIILATLITFLGVSINSASANCYNSNFPPAWFDRDEAQYHVNRACRGYDGLSGGFQGWFGPGETKYVCVNCPDGRDCRLEFTIKNENTGASFDLGDDDCATRLGNEIWGCSNGGESSVSGWHFR